MQEQMFAEARREMEKEMAQTGFGYNPEQTVFMDETQRQSMMENQINETANLMADQYIAE